MRHPTRQQPPATEYDALIDKVTSREAYLPEEVRNAKLDRYDDKQLEGRYNDYLRHFTFETNPRLRAEYKAEKDRTEAELNRRKHQRRTEALKAAA